MNNLIKIIAGLVLAVVWAFAGTTVHDTAPRVPAVKASPAATFCPKPADPISIRSVHISENPIHAGSRVSGTIVATCNVAAVTAQVGTFRVVVPKTSPGIFRTIVDVPHFVWPGRFSLIVTAIRSDGATVSTKIPIDVRW
jgi:hypothetical protein